MKTTETPVERLLRRLMTVLILAVCMNRATDADFVVDAPVNLGSAVNSAYDDGGPTISSDGLDLYFYSTRPGGLGGYDLWVTTRPTTLDEWEPPVWLGPTVNSSSTDFNPDISTDGLELYFSSERAGGRGGSDIWVATRQTTSSPWNQPSNLGPAVNTTSIEHCPSISSDGLTLYFSREPFDSSNIWVSTRDSRDNDWTTAVRLDSVVNSAFPEWGSSISSDDLALFFNSSRPGGSGGEDIWMTKRPTSFDLWSEPINLGVGINTPYADSEMKISSDGRMLYLSGFPNPRPEAIGSYDIWQAEIVPIVDLNGSGQVDTADLTRVIESWGNNDPTVDVGPGPLGDGVVDVADLEVFMSYWRRPVTDPTLTAHWTFDEADGEIAHDSAGDNVGYVMGSPIWQPGTGQVGGAIQLDGVSDAIVAGAPLNPADGPFSVLVWVKGGSAGQAIISEPAGPDWLSIDPLTGHLMTELTNAGRGASFLLSSIVIDDGNWHRIALVWDGLSRVIYVDGTAVAEDTQNGLESPAEGFYIGTGKDMAPGTFFSGLIDDVRIYNRAVTP